jgi:hypothetical protein
MNILIEILSLTPMPLVGEGRGEGWNGGSHSQKIATFTILTVQPG